jgi:uncharacterized protein YdeI (YjbR/CyaY-like superfamily)
MGTTDPRVDAYIAKAAPFARPILTHIRELVHATCPEVEETIKWSVPFFNYHGTMCQMVAFKEHAGFGFWKGVLVVGRPSGDGDGAAGQFGRITSVKDLPTKKELTAYIKKAMALNEEGVSVPKAKKAKPEIPAPPELVAALAKNKKAKAAFEAFPPSHRREYSEWIAQAKGEDTRARRVEQAIEWIAEGKSRNWKYEKR